MRRALLVALLAPSLTLFAQEAPVQVAQAPEAEEEELDFDPEPPPEPPVARGSSVNFSVGVSGLIGGGLLLISNDDSAISGTGTTGTR